MQSLIWGKIRREKGRRRQKRREEARGRKAKRMDKGKDKTPEGGKKNPLEPKICKYIK